MSDVVTPVAPAAQPAPSFTAEPLKVSEPATSAVNPEVATAEKSKEAVSAENLVSALAKASSEVRASKKGSETLQAQIAELTKQLDAKKDVEAKLTKAEKDYIDIVSNPKKLLANDKWSKVDGGAFKAILEELAKDDEPENPRLSELERKLTERETKDAADALAAEKAKADTATAETEQVNAQARSGIAAIVKAEGAKPGGDGIPRWALVMGDEGAVERSRVEALTFCLGKGKPGEAGYRPALSPTSEQALDLVMQALDQMEVDARNEVTSRVSKINKPQQSSNDSFSKPKYSTEEKQAPQSVVAGIKGQPLPTPPTQYVHGFTGGQ